MYDIHSPRVPSVDEIEDLLCRALRILPADRVWVNPDCGLKTRTYPQVGRPSPGWSKPRAGYVSTVDG